MGRDNELPLAIVFRAFSRSWFTIRIANQCHGKVMTPCNKLLRCASAIFPLSNYRANLGGAGKIRTYNFLLSLELW